MLSKSYRISKKKDIEQIFKKGFWVRNKILSLAMVKNNLEKTRFVVTISLKVSKKSTVRNKIKRQINEIIRLNLNKLKPGYDLAIVVTKNDILSKTYQNIDSALNKLFFKAKLID